MPSPFHLAGAEIVACLRERFGLPADSAEPLDVGDPGSRIFRVRMDDDALFVKLRPGPPNEPGLRLPRFLADRGIDVAVAPIPTLDHRSSAELDGAHLVACPYVDGGSGGDVGMTSEHWMRLGAAMRRIHDLAPPVELTTVMRAEDFTPIDLPRVRAIPARIADGRDHPAAQALAALCVEHREDLDRITARIDELAEPARMRSDERAICHADIHPWNVLVRANGDIAIVDWDDAMLAPRERDLMMLGIFAEPGERAAFREGYGPFDADPVLIAYYQFERVVQDLAACGEVVLHDDATDDARWEELRGVRTILGPAGTAEVAFASDDALSAG